jgi:hypothetical protein
VQLVGTSGTSLRIEVGPVKLKSINLGLDLIAITLVFALKVVAQLFSHDLLIQVETRNVMGRVVDSGKCASIQNSVVHTQGFTTLSLAQIQSNSKPKGCQAAVIKL